MRNISAKADGVGDTLPASDFNANLRSELQNIVTSAGFTLDPEGGPDTDVEMLGKTVTQYANAGQYYQDSGAANAYVLARVGSLKALTSYIDGVTVLFKAGNANTGASTINVSSLGAKALRDNTDAALVGGEIIANGYVIARYNASNDRFEILHSQSTKDLPVPSASDALQNIQVNVDGDAYELAGPLTSFKNRVTNSKFQFWDYAITQTTSGYGSDNRWLNSHSGSTKTHSQQTFATGQTDVPNNPEFFSRTVVTTGSGASDFTTKKHRIENVEQSSNAKVSVSFWAKADSSKNIATEFVQSFGTGGSPSSIVTAIGVTTFALTTSWSKYTVTVDLPSISGKTLGTNNDDFLEFNFWFEAGSDYNIRTNSIGNQSGTFDIANVQIEYGPVVTDFEFRTDSVERTLVDYFARIYSAGEMSGFGVAGSTNLISLRIPLTTRLRNSINLLVIDGTTSTIDVRQGGAAYSIVVPTDITSVTNFGDCVQIATSKTGAGAQDSGYTIINHSKGLIFSSEL